MKLKAIPNIVKLAFQEFGKDRASTLGAALAYYTIFSIGPLLIVAIGIAGAVFGDAAARGEVMNTIKSYMGEDAANIDAVLLQVRGSGDPMPTSQCIRSIPGWTVVDPYGASPSLDSWKSFGTWRDDAVEKLK